MIKKSANERTFQGELYRIISKLIEENENIKFSKITQEENVGIENTRFADGKLYSKVDKSKIVLFELKNASWDATDETLVLDAMRKAAGNGYEYFVTGTPRQLVIYKTFKAILLILLLHHLPTLISARTLTEVSRRTITPHGSYPLPMNCLGC